MTAGLRLFDIDPADLDPNGIAEDQTLGGAGNVVLNGTLCDAGTAAQSDIGDGYSAGIGGVMLLFDSDGATDTAVNFTITGKDQDGNSITEVVTGVTTTAVSTTKYYSQVTQIAADNTVSDNLFIGTVTGELTTRTFPINVYSQVPAAVAVSGLSGTCQFDLQETFEDVLKNGSTGVMWSNIISNQTTDVSAVATIGASAVRLKMDSYTNGAELQLHIFSNPIR